MFEKEIKVIYDFSINEVKRLGSFFTYEELTSVDLHPAILKYISAELDYLIYEDRFRLLSNSNFDYSGGRIAEYFALIGEEIKSSKKFAFDYANNLILQAIAFNVNFLAQPNWALTKLVFEKENEIRTAELRQIINYTYFNDYLKAIIEKYLQKKNLQIISRQEFETILDKIDQELLSLDPSKVFNLVLRSIGEFFNIGSVLKSKIPLYPFKLYLKEKKLQSYAGKIENAFRGDARQSCDIVELQNVLFAPEVAKRPIERKPIEQKPFDKKPFVEKPSVEKSSVEKSSIQKPKEQKPLVQKPIEPKPAVQKPTMQKPTVQKPVVPSGENYLDRIMRQEEPTTFFSFGRSAEEEMEKNLSAAKEEVPEEEKTPSVEENPAVKEEVLGTSENLTEDSETARDKDVSELESLLNADKTSGEGENSGSESVLEEESAVLELSKEEMPPSEPEFDVVEETEALLKDAPAEEKPAEQKPAEQKPVEQKPVEQNAPEQKAIEQKPAEQSAPEDKTAEPDEIFSGINIDNIDIDITEEQEEKANEESASGFFSKFKRKGKGGSETKKSEDFSIKDLIKDDPGILPSEPGIITENEAPDSEPENAFSRVFSVISEVFSRREQEKIISEIFENRPEKFANTVYNVITEAHDVYDAERLIDSVLKSKGIDLSSKWAKIFKKNIKQYFNTD